MKDRKPDFDEFLRLSRQGLDEDDMAAPPGFAVRVAARGLGAERGTASNGFVLWERAVSWGAAATLAVCLVTAWYCRADFTAAGRAADSLAAFAELDGNNDGTP
jgi:hypothetical protein